MLAHPSADRHPARPTRRAFLRAGALGLGGLSLADLLRIESRAGIGSSSKSVINIHLDGGPPHLDMIDLKPDAPLEVRGELRGIQTSLPGYSICELMPRIASMSHKIAFIRSIVGSAEAHDAFQLHSGFVESDLRLVGGRPAVGSVVAKLNESSAGSVPAFIDLMQGRPLVRNSARAGFLGRAYQPFRPDISRMFARKLEPGMVKELAAKGADHAVHLTLPDGLTASRVHRRVSLQRELGRLRKEFEADSASASGALDRFSQQAVEILTSGRLEKAMDLASEDPRSLARYTLDDPSLQEAVGHGEGAGSVRKFLLARRLVEAGARFVSISLSDFDTHSDNFPRLRRVLPILDLGLSTLIQDLDERGLLGEVSIVVWGEFGRTPKIDAKTGGRHHWPKVGMAMLAGGGIRAGQVIGSTDRMAAAVASRPVHVQDVLATVYHNLGIDVERTLLHDPTGRPQVLLDKGRPIAELV